MVRKRYPEVRDTISEISRDTQAPSIRAVVECQVRFQLVGFAAPSWNTAHITTQTRKNSELDLVWDGNAQPATKVLEKSG